MRISDPWYAEAERLLKTLANVNRLRLIELLQSPRPHAELPLPPSRGTADSAQRRVISRQALHQHLRALARLGIVEKVGVPESQDPHYVVNRARLYSHMQLLQRLTRVRAEVEVPADVVESGLPYRVDQAGPHLVLVRGADEGTVFPLAPAGEWTLGRARASDVCLDYDLAVAPAHARIVAASGRYELHDLASPNGSFVNWRRVHAPHPLAHGDVVAVGTSLLLVRLP